jgi:hypothetical protein
VTFWRNRPDRPRDVSTRDDGKKAQPDERRRDESTRSKIGIRRRDEVVKPWHLLMKLCADTTHQYITIHGHFPQHNRWPILHCTISLRHRREHYITLLHTRDSAL